ncbi:MAG: glycosyltransferase family 4 protein [Candidatus Omnitrophica bacterium]|nr:glycosyltransferase family 4 protein [Candidatus Omnitrophota bacterium]MBU2044548.1 glycosyltransferase family 4 protein [Candidatus Omnitrophota bacterium]MBU2265614.1 glycosyltransferase family 4 protein [Candidatus Omnitrophota bacterium]MBU2473610.1 glycosyltransferase family 4 protein [Candidatus Omnitrophota bacterium]
MNVLILATHLNPGGISRYVLNLSKGLIKQGHRVLVASSGGDWVEILENSGAVHKTIPIKTKSIASMKVWVSFLFIKKMILEEKIDIVHSNTRVTQFLGGLIYCFLKVPYLSVYHGFYRPGLFRRFFPFSGVLSIAVSKKVRRHLIRDLWISEKKIRVVYNGVDLDEFFPGQCRKQDQGFSAGDFLIGILGRVSQEKGHFLAVEAMKKLLDRYKNIYLVISGEGKLKEKLEKLLAAENLGQQVRFLVLPPGQFLDLIDLLIVPSAKEGFGYSVIEAFAKKVPVIGYCTGGIPEIIRSRENGILFYNYEPYALAAAIEEVMSDDSLREKIVTAAAEDVFQFSLTQMALETLKVHQEILE